MTSRTQFPFQLLLPLSRPEPQPQPWPQVPHAGAPTPTQMQMQTPMHTHTHTPTQTHAQMQMQMQMQTQTYTHRPTPTLTPTPTPNQTQGGMWSEDEHDRFLEAMQFYPQGPWRDIAEYVGTRSVRQVQTHAQKYHEKIARRLRGLRKDRKRLARPEHRIDADMLSLCREYSVESVRGPSAAPPATLWGSFAGPSGDLLAPRDYPHQFQHQHQSHQCQCQCQPHQHQHQPHGDPMFRDYRAYDYIAYIEEEFAFRDAAEDEDAEDEDAAAGSAATGSAAADLPAFSDCLDYLIDVFGPHQLQRTSSVLRVQRHRF